MNSTVTGKCKKDYAIIECDENAFKEVSRYIHCDVILVTNVFRDQLDRYGEVTHTLNAIKESVKNLPNAIVCLDADCSLTYSMSKEIPNKIITFGVNVPFDKNAKAPEISDAKYCIFVSTNMIILTIPMVISAVLYATIADIKGRNLILRLKV